MKKFAVAYVDEDNSLSIEFIEAEWWKEALMKHKHMVECWGDEETPMLPNDMEDARRAAYRECGFEFDVKEI